MKLVIAIVSAEDSSRVSRAVTKQGFSVTKLATTGGFLMSGNTTFMVGTDEEKVPELIEILKTNCKTRKKLVPASASYAPGMFASAPIEVQVGGATVFVVDVDRFYKL